GSRERAPPPHPPLPAPPNCVRNNKPASLCLLRGQRRARAAELGGGGLPRPGSSSCRRSGKTGARGSEEWRRGTRTTGGLGGRPPAQARRKQKFREGKS